MVEEFYQKRPQLHVPLAGADGARLSGIAFCALQSELGALLLNAKGRALHVAASLKADEWQGNVRVQAQIRDAAPAS